MPRPIIQTFARRLDVDRAAALVAGGCGCPGESAAISRETFALADTDPTPGAVTWSGVIGVENLMTGDGRMIETNALRWEDLPIPLRHSPVDNGGHDGAMIVGRILSITRNSNGDIEATGDFDAGSPEGLEAIRQVEGGLTPGVSMDLDDVSFEVRVAKDLLGDEGLVGVEETPVVDPEDDHGDHVTVMKMESDDEVMVTLGARIRAATIVQIPAFSTAKIKIDGTKEKDDNNPDDQQAPAPTDGPPPPLPPKKKASTAVTVLRASAIPVDPPTAWFRDPEMTESSALTVTADGRIYGHLALWGTCHVGYPGQCVSPPSSSIGYAAFRLGAVLTAEGDEVPVGHITMDTMHAAQHLSAADTISHYEHTGRTVADVAAGEDAFGIWLAGALRPRVTPEQVRDLRSSPISGDWRRSGGNLELVGALAVNVPGFPVPRPQGLVASGVMTSLVASGMVPPRQVIPPGTPGALSLDDLRYLKRLAARERAREQTVPAADVAALSRRVQAVQLAARVRSVK